MAGCFRCVKRRNPRTKDIKLIIIGLDNAGKTTTVACLQGESPDGIAPTVGFSNTNLRMGKWNVTIYDVGGGVNVRTVWQNYYAEVYGIIFAVDSGDHNRLVESRNVLDKICADPKVAGKPIVVFANKQDKDGSLNEEEVSKQLALQELSKKHNFKYNVFSCSAIQGYGKAMDSRIRTGLEWLLNSISQDYTIIDEKVTKESALQIEQERKEKSERMERIKKLREEREKAAREAGIVEDGESDEEVNPFRSISEQVELTQKREKKAKENMKKIKEYQMKMNDDGVQSEKVKTELEDENIVTNKDIEEHVIKTRKCNDPGFINKLSNDITYCNSHVDSHQHRIIQVSSKENIRDNSPPQMNKKKKTLISNEELDKKGNDNMKDVSDDNFGKHVKKKSILDSHANNYCINESLSDFQTEKEMNDSRAELFLARSSDSLNRREHRESTCCNNKFNDRKTKLSSEFHDVQDKGKR